MVMGMRVLLASACAIGLLVGAGLDAALANSLVIRSNSNSFKAGELLADETVIKLGKNDVLQLMDQDTQKTSSLTGPYEGTVANYSGECSAIARVFGYCRKVKRPVPLGGTRAPRQ
jgi:hypothetical protein